MTAGKLNHDDVALCVFYHISHGHCSWNDFYHRADFRSCSVYPGADRSYPPGRGSRVRQRLFVEGLREDIDATTGDRFNTSFPNVASTPNTTEWYNGLDGMPGPVNGTSMSRYKTTRDR